MDQRQTFANQQELRNILTDIQQQQAPAALLIDRDGLTRMQGHIAAIKEDSISIGSQPEDTITFSEIIAVNGIFRSDYSEC